MSDKYNELKSAVLDSQRIIYKQLAITGDTINLLALPPIVVDALKYQAQKEKEKADDTSLR